MVNVPGMVAGCASQRYVTDPPPVVKLTTQVSCPVPAMSDAQFCRGTHETALEVLLELGEQFAIDVDRRDVPLFVLLPGVFRLVRHLRLDEPDDVRSHSGLLDDAAGVFV